MNTALTNWALRNEFVALDDKRFKSFRQDCSLRMEIKRQSVVFIVEPHGQRPKILSRLFKDLKIGPEGGEILGLDAFTA